MSDTEIWRDIPGYENEYQVSNLGRVKSLNYNHTHRPGILKPSVKKKGYSVVVIKGKNLYVHRLVALAFIPNPNNYPMVNHKDENPNNNRVDNLEWCTNVYNLNYGTCAERKGKSLSKALKGVRKNNGVENPACRRVRCINTGEEFDYIQLAQKKYNTTHISACCRGKQKTSGRHPITKERLRWEYID